MRLVPGVHYRVSRVIAHARRAHEVEGGVNNPAVKNLHRARSLQRWPSHRRTMFQDLQTVLAVCVSDPRGGNAARVLHLRIEFHPIGFLRQVLAHDGEANQVRKALAHHPMVLGTPRHRLIRKAAPGVMQRAKTPFQQEGVATHKTPLWVGFIELLAESRNPKGSS